MCASSVTVSSFSLPRLQNANLRLLRYPHERENGSLPHVSTPVAFQHLWYGSPYGTVDIQIGWKSKCSTMSLQFSSVFRTDDQFWCGAAKIVQSGVFVSVQP
ncbi:hypothetical protein AVEN_257826-1 [Araneus ventricosus]|uniref:Uncharacterized protein n=1 Tax=Araneus ventricosus TaxID=182803 RepID=A0A4Y2MA58_ARAVE|nr:hypothetical protein AVEN_257826-1 [Araneus ventricosus]